MRFYTKVHRYTCGIDLHARTMHACVIEWDNTVIAQKKLKCSPRAFLQFIRPYQKDVVVGVECLFTWYWLADLCADEGINFALGHALYMKAIHGAKAKNDKLDARKLAVLLKGGNFPLAYAYPAMMRATRDLLRRRNHFQRKRSELLTHVANTNHQYNLTLQPGREDDDDFLDVYADPCVQKSVETDYDLIDFYDLVLKDLESHLIGMAQTHDPKSVELLKTVPGIGRILSLVLVYEIQDVRRFRRVQDFASYSRLVGCAKESAGKRSGVSGRKIGNAHLKWAFSEAAVMMLRHREQAKRFVQRKARKHGKGKALSILAHKIGRAVYFMLKHQEPFDEERFFATG